MSDITVGSELVHKDSGVNVEVVDYLGGQYRLKPEFVDVCAWYCKEEVLEKYKPREKGRKHSHYHKDVSQYDTIDVYAVCKIFDVQDTSGCLQHAIKKLLVTGKRGHKDRKTDIQNAIDTLNRLLELESEAADD